MVLHLRVHVSISGFSHSWEIIKIYYLTHILILMVRLLTHFHGQIFDSWAADSYQLWSELPLVLCNKNMNRHSSGIFPVKKTRP